jgi:hypothetical protein
MGIQLMNISDIQALLLNIDELIFSQRGKHLDDLELVILEGALDKQKYGEIAKKNHHSEKYVKDVAAKLWKTLSIALGQKVSKNNIKSSLQRYYYYYSNSNTNVVNSVQIYKDNICLTPSENDLRESIKLETVSELLKEGLSIEQIAKVLKLPVELIKKQSES